MLYIHKYSAISPRFPGIALRKSLIANNFNLMTLTLLRARRDRHTQLCRVEVTCETVMKSDLYTVLYLV